MAVGGAQLVGGGGNTRRGLTVLVLRVSSAQDWQQMVDDVTFDPSVDLFFRAFHLADLCRRIGSNGIFLKSRLTRQRLGPSGGRRRCGWRSEADTFR